MFRHVDITALTMRALDEGQIARYLAADEPFDCCGSYRFESRGAALFERVATSDATAIEGLPLLALAGMLIRLGYEVP